MKNYILIAAFVVVAMAMPQGPADPESGHLIGCDDDSICADGKKCNLLTAGIIPGSLKPHKGACVPISCDDKGQCPPQGIPISGVLNGQCKEDEKTCDYGMGIAILIA